MGGASGARLPDGSKHVALLRGINVGGKNRVAMADLVRMFEEAGCSDVRTYVQSGNVVFGAPGALARRIGRVVSARIEEELGFRPHVVVRTGGEMARIATDHPFARDGMDPKTLHVGFLDSVPGRDRVARLDPERSPGDRFEVRGKEIFFHFPAGVGKTRLTTAYIESTLATACTMRNWRTVGRLAEMAGTGAGR